MGVSWQFSEKMFWRSPNSRVYFMNVAAKHLVSVTTHASRCWPKMPKTREWERLDFRTWWEYQCRQNHEENNMKKKRTNTMGIKHDSLKRVWQMSNRDNLKPHLFWVLHMPFIRQLGMGVRDNTHFTNSSNFGPLTAHNTLCPKKKT